MAPLSSQVAKHNTIKARLWPRLSGESPLNVSCRWESFSADRGADDGEDGISDEPERRVVHVHLLTATRSEDLARVGVTVHRNRTRL